jgi:hypothetical protein
MLVEEEILNNAIRVVDGGRLAKRISDREEE